jgi:predicted nucleic acid-binding protein
LRSLESYVVDTSILVAYIVENEPGRNKVIELFKKAFKNHVELYITYQTLSETIYIAYKIYSIAGEKEPNRRALEFAKWITNTMKIVELNPEIAFRAGELKKILNIALTDCYVIATAEYFKTKALFLKPEKEMLKNIELLRKLPISFILPWEER